MPGPKGLMYSIDSDDGCHSKWQCQDQTPMFLLLSHLYWVGLGFNRSQTLDWGGGGGIVSRGENLAMYSLKYRKMFASNTKKERSASLLISFIAFVVNLKKRLHPYPLFLCFFFLFQCLIMIDSLIGNFIISFYLLKTL